MNTSRIISKGKDRTNTLHVTNSVYALNCNNCDAIYIGQTKRHLYKRVDEHKKSKTNQITVHSSLRNHTFNFLKPTILDREPNYNKRLISEAIHIGLIEQALFYKMTTLQNLPLTLAQ